MKHSIREEKRRSCFTLHIWNEVSRNGAEFTEEADSAAGSREEGILDSVALEKRLIGCMRCYIMRAPHVSIDANR